MMALAIKGINLAALLVAVAWLARAPDWEPVVTSLVLLATLVGQELAPSLRGAVDQHDRRLFDQFLEDFPSNGSSARFLSEHDIGNSFPRDDLDQLTYFTVHWDNAEREFHDKALEKNRQKLLRLAKEFRHDLSLNIFPIDGGWFSMELRDYEDRPKKLEKRDALNKQATEVYEVHQGLVRLGTKKLKK